MFLLLENSSVASSPVAAYKKKRQQKMVRKGYENFVSPSVGNQLWRTTNSLCCFAGVLWAISFAVMSLDEVFDHLDGRSSPRAAMLKME